MNSTSESSVWTFFLGPGRVKQTIHSDLARHVSPELEKFVQEKSVVKDSKLGSGSVVTLEEFDAETFAAFWAYTYRGDYKAPKPPVPREKTRRESTLSPTGTWRGIYRSDSMSSGVPPPAPSPPGSVSSASRSVRRQIEPKPQLQIQTQPQPQPQLQLQPQPQVQPEPEPEPEHQPEANPVAGEEPLAETPMQDTPVEDTPAMPENGSYEVVEPVEAEAQPDVEADAAPAAETDPWDFPNDTKSKKGKKGKKGKKKNQDFTEEAPVNFTPPSTPPPELPADLDEAQLGVPEQTAETNPVDWHDEPSAPAEPEPAYDAPTPAEPEPEPETVVEAEKPTEEREQAEGHAPEEAPQEQWEIDVEDQNQAPTKPSIDMSFAKQSQAESSPRTPGLSLWDEFAALQYNDEQTPTQTPTTSETEVPYLTFHAKVYVFATRFLIPSLAQLCLRKLHRALLSLALEDADAMTPIPDFQPLGDLATLQAPMVLDLLRYTYTHTGRLEPISETVATQVRENELRRLVVHYAACKLKALARYHSPGDSEAVTPAFRPMDAKNERSVNGLPRNLRVLLDTTPELASDVVYRMM